jgi:hypothetical protein
LCSAGIPPAREDVDRDLVAVMPDLGSSAATFNLLFIEGFPNFAETSIDLWYLDNDVSCHANSLFA